MNDFFVLKLYEFAVGGRALVITTAVNCHTSNEVNHLLKETDEGLVSAIRVVGL